MSRYYSSSFPGNHKLKVNLKNTSRSNLKRAEFCLLGNFTSTGRNISGPASVYWFMETKICRLLLNLYFRCMRLLP